MNPTAFVITAEQLAQLKAEIIDEVRRGAANESPKLVQQTESRFPVMDAIRELTDPLFGCDSPVQPAISSIIRKTLDVKLQSLFFGERQKMAIEMVKELVAVIEKYRHMKQ
ncbi:hypothetical protein [Paenibacillus sp. sgz302251]|uniref:hypothetical protein n=1 Tax=Paenibacillus sp. sgz302251 TaxID=3414493 RepID=UPI003C7E299F